MTTLIRSLVIAFITIGFTHLLPAQMRMHMGPPDIAGVFDPTVGSGSSYEMVRKDGGEKISFDIYVVDKDSSGAYWVEYAMQNPRMNGTVYVKNLVARQGDDLIVQRTIMQMPGRPPMDMSSMMKMHPMQSEESKADFRANAENLGTETITTPAGSFSCQHWRSKKDGTEVWISNKVSPWGLVKMSGPHDTMTLVKIITDAKSHITGTPVSMEDMMRQHMRNPQ
jgi:hypothetical protein